MIDLHIHSRYSEDGELTPAELVRRCGSVGIDTMAITDHNCVRGVSEAMEAAAHQSITCIPAIEIDCTFQDTYFHVLGYGIDFSSDDFAAVDKNIDDQSFQASLIRLYKTQKLGFYVTENEMWEAAQNQFRQGHWTGELFAEVLLQKESCRRHPLLNAYRPGGSRSDRPFVNFCWDFYSQGKPCYAEITYPPMEQIIEVIHRNHGKAVLAHPGVNLRGREAMLPAIAALGIDGLEVFSSYHSPQQTDYFDEQAKKLGLYRTAGSDFHGKCKPSISLGAYSKSRGAAAHQAPLSEWLAGRP